MYSPSKEHVPRREYQRGDSKSVVGAVSVPISTETKPQPTDEFISKSVAVSVPISTETKPQLTDEIISKSVAVSVPISTETKSQQTDVIITPFTDIGEGPNIEHPELNSTCDVLPTPIFDFALADPLSANIYELLKSTFLYLDATKSPICSTVRTAIIQFEQFAAISSVTIAAAVTSSIHHQLTAQGFLIPTKQCYSNFSPAALNISGPEPTIVCSLATPHDEFLSLLDDSASQFESHRALIEQQILPCEHFKSLKNNFMACEADNFSLNCALQLEHDYDLHLASYGVQPLASHAMAGTVVLPMPATAHSCPTTGVSAAVPMLTVVATDIVAEEKLFHDPQGSGRGKALPRQDPRPSSGSRGVFAMIRIDPSMVTDLMPSAADADYGPDLKIQDHLRAHEGCLL